MEVDKVGAAGEGDQAMDALGEELRSWLGAPARHLPPRGGRQDYLGVFAGEARITRAVLARGGSAIQIGRKHGHDLRRRRDVRLLLFLIEQWGFFESWPSWPCHLRTGRPQRGSRG